MGGALEAPGDEAQGAFTQQGAEPSGFVGVGWEAHVGIGEQTPTGDEGS